jgi:hypothetical protein
MPRGGHRVKSVKPAQTDASASPPIITKPTRRNTDWSGILKPTFLTRNLSETKLAAPVPIPSLPVREPSRQQDGTSDFQMRKPSISVASPTSTASTIPIDSIQTITVSECEENNKTSISPPIEPEQSVRPTCNRNPSSQSTGEDSAYEEVLHTVEDCHNIPATLPRYTPALHRYTPVEHQYTPAGPRYTASMKRPRWASTPVCQGGYNINNAHAPV